MTFATPWALLALLLIPLVVLALVLARRRRIRYAIRYPALDVLAGVVERERRGRWIPAALLVLALTALLLGAARPMARVPVPRDEATVVLIIDVSGSMNADDVEPTRMEAAQRAASRFLDRLPARFQVGLVTFSNEAETLVPSTTAPPGPPDPGTQAPGAPAVTLLLADGATSAGGDPFVQAEGARQRRVP